MKKSLIFVLAAFVITTVHPVFSQQSNQEKVICELAAHNCLNQIDILQKRIKKLDTAIKKNSKTISAEDLKKLEQKLQETKELLDKMEAPANGK